MTVKIHVWVQLSVSHETFRGLNFRLGLLSAFKINVSSLDFRGRTVLNRKFLMFTTNMNLYFTNKLYYLSLRN